MPEKSDQQIKGYRDLSPDDINHINLVKDAEISAGEVWRAVMALPGVDKRWAAVAKTHFEEGFSALVRSIAQPESRF